MTYPGEKLFTIDRKNDKLIDITKSIFSKHPEISSGLAKIILSNDYFDLLTNDGHKYYYVPQLDLLTKDYDEVEKAVDQTYPERWFKFDYSYNLLKMTRNKENSKTNSTNILPSRTFFQPKILYQDSKSIIIATHATANTHGPVMLQSLSVETGEIIWSQPSSMLDYRTAAKCNEGFAINYFSGEVLDYISGVLVISPEGKVISDYLIKRGE